MGFVELSPGVLIERLEVTGGFLDRLDLRFSPGLNVIVGARGTGKTSVIELLRYCTDAPALTERYGAGSREHALSVLRDGKATVTLRIGDERYKLSRSSREEPVDSGHPRPIVLSQNEVEVVGVDERGRLRLLDEFRHPNAERVQRASAAQSKIRSLSREVVELDAEMSLLQERLAAFPDVKARLEAAREEASASEASIAGATSLFTELDAQGQRLAEATTAREVLTRTLNAIEKWHEQITSVLRAQPSLETWPTSGVNPLGFVTSSLDDATEALDTARERASAVSGSLRESIQRQEQKIAAFDDRLRELRSQAETMRSGAGVAARTVAELQEAHAHLEQLSRAHVTQQRRRDIARAERDDAVRHVEQLRRERFEDRLNISRGLNAALTPRVRIDLQKGGLYSSYADAIADALRGSGLQYNQVAPVLAERVAPSELAAAVEDGDDAFLASTAGVSAERASRILTHLRHHGLGDMLAASIDDAVTLELLDGDRYKPTTEVSTGQRCTVVLPIVLQHTARPVVLDQPEDHLDTAFIVETLVQALRGRSASSQLIVSTHNANVPVLGEADRVTILHSDGSRGFVRCTGPLEQADIVRSIETIMEGGREAFATRAAFYNDSFSDGLD